MFRAAQLQVSILDVPLLAPFGIATGAQHIAHNVLVGLGTDDGTWGYGEAAPVAHISGETQADVVSALHAVAPLLKGSDLMNYRPLCSKLSEALSHVPSALAAVEMALFDALCKRFKTTMLQLFGAAETSLNTDITIVTGTDLESSQSARNYAAQGFTRLKVKVGGAPLKQDIQRLFAIGDAAPQAELILDGNTAFSVASALELLEALGERKSRVILFEQPVMRDDFDGLKEVELKSGVPVAADESLRSTADFERLVRLGGVSAINIKTAKLGVLQAWDLLVAARRIGLKVMMGGMVETELSMTVSACLAAGVGGVSYVDLDTPLLLAARPLRGGFRQRGPLIELGELGLGHGVTPTG